MFSIELDIGVCTSVFITKTHYCPDLIVLNKFLPALFAYTITEQVLQAEKAALCCWSQTNTGMS